MEYQNVAYKLSRIRKVKIRYKPFYPDYGMPTLERQDFEMNELEIKTGLTQTREFQTFKAEWKLRHDKLCRHSSFASVCPCFRIDRFNAQEVTRRITMDQDLA